MNGWSQNVLWVKQFLFSWCWNQANVYCYIFDQRRSKTTTSLFKKACLHAGVWAGCYVSASMVSMVQDGSAAADFICLDRKLISPSCTVILSFAWMTSLRLRGEQRPKRIKKESEWVNGLFVFLMCWVCVLRGREIKMWWTMCAVNYDSPRWVLLTKGKNRWRFIRGGSRKMITSMEAVWIDVFLTWEEIIWLRKAKRRYRGKSYKHPLLAEQVQSKEAYRQKTEGQDTGNVGKGSLWNTINWQ